MNIHMKQCKVTYLDFHFCFQCYVFLLETRLPPTLEGLPTNNFITSFLLFDPFGMTLNCQILCNILSWTFCHCYSFRKTPMNYYRFFLKLVWIFFNFRNVYYYVATTIWQYLVTLRLLKLVHFLQVMNIMVLNFYLTYNIGFFQHLTLVVVVPPIQIKENQPQRKVVQCCILCQQTQRPLTKLQSPTTLHSQLFKLDYWMPYVMHSLASFHEGCLLQTTN